MPCTREGDLVIDFLLCLLQHVHPYKVLLSILRRVRSYKLLNYDMSRNVIHAFNRVYVLLS